MEQRDLDKTGAGTRAVWGGEDEHLLYDTRTLPVVHPIVQSVTFAYSDLEEWHEVALQRRRGHIYSRNTNPTVRVFEEKVRLLEGGEDSTSFATGMAGISNTLFTLLSPGDRIVSLKETYGGTSQILSEFLPRFNVDVSLCDTDDHEALEAEIAKGCKVLYLETPTNPTLKVVDIERLAKSAKAVGATVIVDSTFATPVNQNPLALGADLVIHSATKFLGGHSDAMGGVMCGSRELIRKVFHFREINGATLDAMSAYLLLRGLKTLELRVLRQNENAMRIARFLDEHPKIESVFYPGLESHRGHEIAKRQMRGYGGMLSFAVHGGFDAVRTVLHHLKLAYLAASLGAVETLAAPPRTSSHVEVAADQRARLGIPESLIRYSVGIEDADDLIADLSQALAAVP
jgi:cystathionine gamma-synthase